MAYHYGGNEMDAHLPAPEYVKTRPSCGKRSGYVLHRQNNEDACQPCLDANAAYQSDYWYLTKARKAAA